MAYGLKAFSRNPLKIRKATLEHNCTILLLALTSGDKKLEIRIPCPDAKA